MEDNWLILFEIENRGQRGLRIPGEGNIPSVRYSGIKPHNCFDSTTDPNIRCRHRSNCGKISAQPHTTLCIQFLDRENNDKNNTLSLGKQICLTIVWCCAEILPKLLWDSKKPYENNLPMLDLESQALGQIFLLFHWTIFISRYFFLGLCRFIFSTIRIIVLFSFAPSWHIA